MSEQLVRRRLFREVNERIRSVNLRFGMSVSTYGLLCECGDESCLARFEVPVAVYEELRTSDDLQLVASGHTTPPATRVVACGDGYDVVSAGAAIAA